MFRRYGHHHHLHITAISIESFPHAAEMIVKGGHEIGVHGYLHENPLAMTASRRPSA